MTKQLWFRMIEQARLRRHGVYAIGFHLQGAPIIRYRLHLANMEARFGVGCLAGLAARGAA